jgi:putative transposase
LKVTRLCQLAKMTVQNYYARRATWHRQEVDLGLILELVRAERQQQPRLGVRKLYHLIAPELRAAGVKLGRDRLFVELGKAGMLVERKPAEWPRTTNFNAHLPVFKNLIRTRKVSRPNQVWVADITYIRTREAFMYLGLITDKWSRKIVGFHLGETLEAKHALKALAMALKGLRPRERPIHHSDRGCQYASHAYVNRVQQVGMRMSMTEQNHSAENALAERVNGILKQEYWLDRNFTNGPEARQATVQGIKLYNTRRPHTALGFKTPAMVHHHGIKKLTRLVRAPALHSGSLRSPPLRAGARTRTQQQQLTTSPKYQIHFRT